jgi:hypothetical protein
MFDGIRTIRFEDLVSARIRQFAGYWRARKGDQAIPNRNDIDLFDIKPLLPYIFVVSIEPNPFRVRYRLAGTNTVDMNEMDLTGYYLDDLQGQQGDWASEGAEIYRAAWEQRSPVYVAYKWPTRLGAVRNVECGLFPVTTEAGEMHVFAVEDWNLEGADSLDPPLPLSFNL